ncbi:MAG: peptidylprolyl isomerase, partial [bacterium]
AFVGTIIFDWGMNITGLKSNPGVIGKVEGIEITARQFDQAFVNELQAYRQRTGNEPPESQLEFMRNQVWEGLVQNVLVQHALQEKGLMATDAEIVWRIYNDPPEILKSNPSFQNDQKQFDKAKYLAVLNDPSTADQWRPIEEYLRQTLPYEKFQQRLQASVRVTQDEIKREYLKQNQTVNVKYLFIDPKRFSSDDIKISDEDLAAYYKQNKAEFKEEEKRQIQYAVFSTGATAEDSTEIRELAASILQRAKAGDDFAELAEIYSEDTGTKDKGGDLGFFGKGTMVKPFEEAAFFSKPGAIVGPVESPFGLHIIKVEEKRVQNGKEEVKARHILFKFSASQKTLDRARDNADFFIEDAKQTSFADAANKAGISLQTSAFFEKGNGFVPGLGLNRKVSNFIFSKNAGEIGDVVESPQGLFVFKINAIQDERIQPFEEVSGIIRDKLKLQQQMALASNLAQAVYSKITNGLSFEEAAIEDSLDLKESGNFTRSGYVAGVGREPSFVGAAFSLNEPGEVSKPVHATRGVYLLKLIEKKPFDQTDFDNNKDRIAAQLQRRKQGEVFAKWYAEAKAKADIKDYRSRFF